VVVYVCVCVCICASVFYVCVVPLCSVLFCVCLSPSVHLDFTKKNGPSSSPQNHLVPQPARPSMWHHSARPACNTTTATTTTTTTAAPVAILQQHCGSGNGPSSSPQNHLVPQPARPSMWHHSARPACDTTTATATTTTASTTPKGERPRTSPLPLVSRRRPQRRPRRGRHRL